MTTCLSTVIEKKKWKELCVLNGIEGKISRSYIVRPMNKATIIMDNNGIYTYDAEWGLIPEWSRNGNIRGTLTHARFESLTTSPSFRIPIRQKRCLIPIDSFYVWHKTGNKKEVPYRVLQRDGEPMYIAGMWDKWISRYGKILTFCLISGEMEEHKHSLGQRVPMVFTDIQMGIKWLQETDLNTCIEMLNIPEYENLKIYRIAENFEETMEEDIHEEIREEITLFD